ncbi:YceD family protein [Pseudaminobacter sp. NGMCC 1.201702]|uniref:YceD family protein n=1 Tax=Pseudaminobacter sp. NGMCC 1.201702 TaxID=3391825 RepID=UPI0039EEFB8A
MSHHAETSPVSFVVNVARLPAKGLPVLVEADEAQCAALAAEHGLEAVANYRAELLVTAWRRDGVKVTGKVEADIVQACVVTLEPIEVRISEDVSVLLVPENSKLARADFEGGGEILLDAEGPDAPETFEGDTVDVGALAEEFFGLAIDPYPRKPGVSLDTTTGEPADQMVDGDLQKKLRELMRKS